MKYFKLNLSFSNIITCMHDIAKKKFSHHTWHPVRVRKPSAETACHEIVTTLTNTLHIQTKLRSPFLISFYLYFRVFTFSFFNLHIRCIGNFFFSSSAIFARVVYLNWLRKLLKIGQLSVMWKSKICASILCDSEISLCWISDRLENFEMEWICTL